MGKDKLKKFEETLGFGNFIQIPFEQLKHPFPFKGRWSNDFFGNTNPLVLEIGCGKGEYTLGLAGRFPDKNFIGIDIKGARMWRGAKTAIENNIGNAAFLRSQAGLLHHFFAADEVSEIWFTFPDPYLRKSKANKRLTSKRYLGFFSAFLKPQAIIHLKTDNAALFDYTLGVIAENNFRLLYHTRNVYSTETDNEICSIQTFYEKMFLAQGMNIHYLRFTM